MNRNASILQFFCQKFTFRHKISTLGALMNFYIWTKTMVDSGWYFIKFGLGSQTECIFGILIPMAHPTNITFYLWNREIFLLSICPTSYTLVTLYMLLFCLVFDCLKLSLEKLPGKLWTNNRLPFLLGGSGLLLSGSRLCTACKIIKINNTANDKCNANKDALIRMSLKL